MKKIAFCCLLFFFGPISPSAQGQASDGQPGAPGFSQKYTIEQFTVGQGLSDNTVNACLQDRQGYLWFGTDDGLNRYDGYSFSVYKHQPGNPHSISNNKINALLEGREGYIWIATDGGLNRFDPRTETFLSFRHNPDDKQSISHNQVNCMLEDTQGYLWLGADHGLNRFDRTTGAFTRYWHRATHRLPWEEEPTHIVTAIGLAADGQLLVGYAGMGLMLFNQRSETFRQVLAADTEAKGMGLNIHWIAPAENGENWVVGTELLFRYGADGKLAPARFKPPGNPLNGFRHTASGRYLASGWNGLSVLDANFQPVDHFLPGGAHPANPTYNWVLGILEDQVGDIWLGAGGAGLFHFNTQERPFSNFQYQIEKDNEFPHSYINALLEVKDDEIWVGTRRHGLKIFDPKTSSFRPAPAFFNSPAGVNTKELSVLFQDSRGDIWIGAWGGGLNLYRPETKTFQYFLTNSYDSTSLSDNFVTDILETDKHEIWVSTTLGVSVLAGQEAIEKGRFKNYKYSPEKPGALNHSRATCLFQDRHGHIWVGSLNGLHRFDPRTDAFILYQQDLKVPNSLVNNIVNSIFEDSRGQLWIGTAGGLEKFGLQTNSFTHYLEPEGLADGYISGIGEDKQGCLWLATKTGISRFNPESARFENYGHRDGLANYRFSPNAFISSNDKDIFYAGGKNGLILFHPDSIRENPFVPPVIISSLRKYNTRGARTEETAVKGIAYQKEIHLTYRDNIIIFELTALNFRDPEKNQYAYRLEGFNDNWIKLGTKREITFTNLGPGQYNLRVKASNNDGIWNETGAALKIIIHPPWWAAWWAYLLYASSLAAILYFLRRYELNRQRLKNKLKLEKLESDKLKELDTFKNRLYTNLTHEFRTPLTVILGMAGQIREKPKACFEEGLRLIESNGQNLLRLINQLLDLSKLENNAFKLHLQQGDILPYLRYVTESFQSYANSRSLSLRFFTPLESLVMDHDPGQVQQVMANLISNAIKFTPSGGEVTVKVDRCQLPVERSTDNLQQTTGNKQPATNNIQQTTNNYLSITVADTGIGIAEEDLPHVFDRFYQARDQAPPAPSPLPASPGAGGAGIGLAHAHELVKLMGGTVSAESQAGKGAKFTVLLPVSRSSETIAMADFQLEGDPVPPSALPPAGQKSRQPSAVRHQPSASLPRLLLIEDNPDVVIYLKSCLEGLYRLDIACNGRIGIEKALENIPGLIVSDVMMPEKDGYEVCDTLKNDERTSHIPIILLTARADAASRIAGLRRGADAYLAKPFDKEELLVRLEKLLERQQRMKAYFSKSIQAEDAAALSDAEKEGIQLEDAFIQKVKDIVEEYYSDENFGLPQLCQKIGMSRSQLFRKLKAVTDTSPSELIRTHRLNKAKTLLETTGMSVSEVAWEVGYKDLAHFSRSFQEAFGIAPSSVSKS